MDVILHTGAHRCATTSFQHYMRCNAAALAAQGVGFWGPVRTRGGLFHGIQPGHGALPDPRRRRHRRARGRIRLNLARSAARGTGTLVVSDENMLGTIRTNVNTGELYTGAGARLARYGDAIGGRLAAVMLNIRATDAYWMSALGFHARRGRGGPGHSARERLAAGTRGWRDVITELGRALPGVPLLVLPFETFAGQPGAQLSAVTGIAPPRAHAGAWLNATPGQGQGPEIRPEFTPEFSPEFSPEDRQPFSPARRAALREAYADDLMWLAAGADGLARLVRAPSRNSEETAGHNPPAKDLTRGRRHEHEQGRLARHCRKGTARPVAG